MNTISKPHLDGGNNGPSVIVGTGDYGIVRYDDIEEEHCQQGRTVMWPKKTSKDQVSKSPHVYMSICHVKYHKQIHFFNVILFLLTISTPNTYKLITYNNLDLTGYAFCNT